MDGSYLVVNDGTANRLTANKKAITLGVDGDYLTIKHSGNYQTRLLYSAVSSPSVASAELLRTAVKNLLIA